MRNRNYSRTIMVIGNGFDLSCGLNSRYKDFFIHRIMTNIDDFEKLQKWFTMSSVIFIKKKRGGSFSAGIHQDSVKLSDVAKITIPGISDFQLTFWDIYFYYLTLKGYPDRENLLNEIKAGNEEVIPSLFWADVESAIDNFTNNSNEECFNSIFKNTNIFRFNEYREKITDFFRIITIQFFKEKYSKDIEIQDYCGNVKLDYFLLELKKFENVFKGYINSELEDKSDYDAHANNLLNNILGSELDNAYILNFNYSIPHVKSSRPVEETGANVHGDVSRESNIIFGIDSSYLGDNKDSYMFTKTRRKITNVQLSKSYPLPQPEHVKSIKFFGHSLSRADYSYFKSMFDYYNVYSSKVKLTFYYKKFPGSNSTTLREETADKVSILMREYGGSMSNQKEGENLLHKLLLEHRISVEEVIE